MKTKIAQTLFFSGLLGGIYFFPSDKTNTNSQTGIYEIVLPDTARFELKKGDILVRPNWTGMPGSCAIPNGRMYGHVAIVTEDASGKTIEETLAKASVVEALFFDQATRKFQFKKENQIRETSASISFGNRFKGIRYRLRTQLSDDQVKRMIQFLRNQLDGGYNILSLKNRDEVLPPQDSIIRNLKPSNWHCATLAWRAYYLVSGLDIDANKGLLIYPSDIIQSKCFDLPGDRVRF